MERERGGGGGRKKRDIHTIFLPPFHKNICQFFTPLIHQNVKNMNTLAKTNLITVKHATIEDLHHVTRILQVLDVHCIAEVLCLLHMVFRM